MKHNEGNIYVTGAYGFIGSNLLYALEQSGIGNVIAIDTFGNGSKWKNVAKRNSFTYILPEQMEGVLENDLSAQAVIHLGAISSTTETDVDRLMETNFRLTCSLFEICQKKGLQFIYASSAATYGNGENGFEDNEDIIYLNKLRPLNPYGWSKLLSDKYIAAHHGFDSGSQIVGLKFFNVYGPNEYHKGEQASVIWHFFNQILEKSQINLFKSERKDIPHGRQSRDFVFVDDCINAILIMLAHPEVSGLFNVGTGNSQTYLGIVSAISKSLGREIPYEFIDMPYNIKDQYQYFTQANISKLHNLGFKPTSLEDGVDTYIKNYLSQTDQYK